ncbi:MAG: hypothetical protein ACE5D4_06065 [Thermodesulfobacteriota bacterium]
MDAKEFVVEIGDTAIDVVTDIDVLEKVPIISWAIKAFTLKETYQLKRLQINTKAFLEALSQSNKEIIVRFAKRLEEDPIFAEEFSDTVLSILIESQKPIKATMVGSLVVALVRGQISKQEFDDMSLLIQSSSVPALTALQYFFKRTRGKPYAREAQCHEEPLLMSLGVGSRNGGTFQISKIEKKLFYYGCRDLLSNDEGYLPDEWQRSFEGLRREDMNL